MEGTQNKLFGSMQPLICVGKTILALILSLVKNIFQLSQELKNILAFATSYTDIINNLKIQDDEISKLKEKILLLEEKNTATESVKAQIFESQCRLTLLEKGRKLTQRRTY